MQHITRYTYSQTFRRNDAGSEKHVAIAGQDCIEEALQELRVPKSPLVGSVSHEASTYGSKLIHLSLALLSGQTVPPYNYVEHKLVKSALPGKHSRNGK